MRSGFKLKKHAAILVVLLLVFPVSFIDCASAQAEGFSVAIEKPDAGEIINGTSINLHFSVTKGADYVWVETISYNVYLDGDLRNQHQQNISSRRNGVLDANLNLILTNLTQGKHTIRVDLDLYYCPSTWINVFYHLYPSSSVDFFIHREIQPQMSISGLDVYKANQAMFNVTTNEFDSAVSYSLDRGANVTLPQNKSAPFLDSYVYNVTLFGLSEGTHTLTAYAKDVFNQSAMAEKTFTVQQPMPLSTIAVAAVSVAVVALVAAGLLIYHKKTNTTKSRKFDEF